jgi:hypothetical protein
VVSIAVLPHSLQCLTVFLVFRRADKFYIACKSARENEVDEMVRADGRKGMKHGIALALYNGMLNL